MDFHYLTPFDVRFRDLDSLGHVNNAVYLTYFEIARIGYWRELFGPDGWKRMPFLVGDAYLKYIAPIVLPAQVTMGIRFKSFGNKSFVLEYQVKDVVTGKIMAEGLTTQVMVDAKGQTYRVPDEVRQKAVELGFEG